MPHFLILQHIFKKMAKCPTPGCFIWSNSLGIIIRLKHNEEYTKKKELIRKIKVSEICQINMNIYLKIPSSRTYYYAKNVTQEIADENKYVKYLIKKKKKQK